MFKFPTIIVDVSTSPFVSVNYYFRYFTALLFGAYVFRVTISSW